MRRDYAIRYRVGMDSITSIPVAEELLHNNNRRSLAPEPLKLIILALSRAKNMDDHIGIV
jgi:hypothetical protein